LSHILGHKTLETLPEREYEGCFFLANAKKATSGKRLLKNRYK
jgi:hypothetical protein